VVRRVEKRRRRGPDRKTRIHGVPVASRPNEYRRPRTDETDRGEHLSVHFPGFDEHRGVDDGSCPGVPFVVLHGSNGGWLIRRGLDRLGDRAWRRRLRVRGCRSTRRSRAAEARERSEPKPSPHRSSDTREEQKFPRFAPEGQSSRFRIVGKVCGVGRWAKTGRSVWGRGGRPACM